MVQAPPEGAHGLVAHFFRHEYARLVSTLVRSFGPARLELVEDCVQSALALALTSWSLRGVPERPGAWLTRVARNQVLDLLRREQAAQRATDKEAVTAQVQRDANAVGPGGEAGFAGEVEDDQLRMLFVCCDEELPTKTRLVLALKILCGFSIREIALRLLSTEANVYKRLARGRLRLRQSQVSVETPRDEVLRGRLASVRQVIYLLFNEGYSSAVEDRVIRRELCEEALRLGELLASHPTGNTSETWALLAVMNFHIARFSARVDGHGGLLLLEQQDRSKWDRQRIAMGLAQLQRSACGEIFCRYHAEAGILAEHCTAPTFAQTRWSEIVDLYGLLERVAPSPIHTLNKAIALAQWKGPRAGLELIERQKPPGWVLGYYLWDAATGELKRQSGDFASARKDLSRAYDSAPTVAERALLQRRIAACEAEDTSCG